MNEEQPLSLQQATTIQQVLQNGVQTLARAEQRRSAQSGSARLDAQLLLAHVLGVERSILYAYPERLLIPQQARDYLALIGRRARGEPVAYLTGHQEFYGLDYLVDSRVLIPRPETELLVEAALAAIRTRLRAGNMPLVADIGTGSGIIPITLALQEPHLRYLYATDISRDALAVAALNSHAHHVEERVRLLHGDLLEPLPEPVDILIANLPYVGVEEMEQLEPDVRAFEPHLALFSGPKGLDLFTHLFTDIVQSGKLLPEAQILLEIGYQQRDPLTQLIRQHCPGATVVFEKDDAGWDRVCIVQM